MDALALDVRGLRVVSGTGEDLGIALDVESDRFGRPKWVRFVEADGLPPRRVQLRYVRGVEEGVLRLAGPREGYHITRISAP